MNKEYLKALAESTRPKTLPLAGASILMGGALAFWTGKFSLPITFGCLLTTLLLQILSNFANDYGDFCKGADTADRVGPKRGIQKGLLSVKDLKNAMVWLVVLSFITGGGVIALAYTKPADIWIFLTLGILAIVAAITYTVGKKPYGYMGLGDISVLLFFGLLGVMGTFYLQTHYLNPWIFFPALATGLLATAVLNINNLRDYVQDKQAGKNTLIVKIGTSAGVIYHGILLSGAMIFYLIFALNFFHNVMGLVFLAFYPLLINHWLAVRKNQGKDLVPLLGQMAILALGVNLSFALALCFNQIYL